MNRPRPRTAQTLTLTLVAAQDRATLTVGGRSARLAEMAAAVRAMSGAVAALEMTIALERQAEDAGASGPPQSEIDAAAAEGALSADDDLTEKIFACGRASESEADEETRFFDNMAAAWRNS